MSNAILNRMRSESILNNQSCFYMINTYKEYVAKQKERMIEWVNKASEETRDTMNEVVTAPMSYGLKDAMYAITKSNYVDALNGQSSPVRVLKSSGTTESMYKSSDDILGAVENAIGDLTTQEIFLDYCTTATQDINTSDFLTRISALAPGIASRTYTLYTQILDCASDRYEAFKQFFKSKKDTSITNETDTTISVVNVEQYTGNVWTSVLSQIVNEISTAVSAVTKAVHSIGDLFDNIVSAISAVCKWAMGKMFRNLTTDFETIDGIKQGIVDMPLIQCVINLHNTFNPVDPVYADDVVPGNYISYILDFIENIRQNDSSTFLRSGQKYSDPQNTSNVYYRGFQVGRFLNIINHYTKADMINDFIKKITYTASDGSSKRRILEIAIPWQGVLRYEDLPIPDFIVRFGWDDNNNIIMQVFGAVKGKSFTSLSDEDINRHLSQYQTIESALIAALEAWIPFHLPNGSIGANHLISDTASSYTNSFVNYLSELCNPIAQSSLSAEKKALLSAILLYSIIQICDQTSVLSEFCYCECLWNESETTFDENTAIEQHTDESLFVPDTYRPYTTEHLVETCVHYQTVAERAGEYVHLFNVVLVAVAVAFVAYKVTKWVKNRKVKLDLLNGQYDSLTWQYYEASDADKPAILANIMKTRKKKIHVERLNSILGISSVASAQNSLINQSTNLLSEMLGNNGKQKDYTEDFQSVESLIH